jgi:hypothetical protein
MWAESEKELSDGHGVGGQIGRGGRKVFEAYAQNKMPGAYRIFWCYGPNKGDITVIAIAPHP